jgi:hypothetical protein
MEHLGKVICSPLGEIWVSLQEVRGGAQLELRMHGTSSAGKPSSLSGIDAIRLPVDQLPHLLQVLTQVREVCINRGHLYEPGAATTVTMEQGTPVALPLAHRTAPGRRDPRVSLELPVECRLVDPERFWPSPPVAGELRDISLRGAQIWLPRRLPRFRQVDISTMVDGTSFQARATIVSVELETKREPATGLHRHGLQWAAVEPKARELLTAVLAKRAAGGRTASAAHRPQPAHEPGPPVSRQDHNPPTLDAPEGPGGVTHQGQAKAADGMPPPVIGDRRRAPRIALPQPVTVRARVGEAREVWLLDLSLTGARIEHRAPLRPGTACALGFPAAFSPLVLDARVVHSVVLGAVPGPGGTRQRHYATGLTFVDVTPEQQAVLNRIVEWLALGGSAEGILTVSSRLPDKR